MLLETVMSRFLFIGPANREILQLRQRVIHDSAVAQRGTDHLVAAASKGRDQLVESSEVQNGARSFGGRHSRMACSQHSDHNPIGPATHGLPNVPDK